MRILLLKEKRGLFADPYTTHAAVDRVVGTRGHLATADRIADRTTTLLRNEAGLLPLSRRRERRCWWWAPTPPRRPAPAARPPRSWRRP